MALTGSCTLTVEIKKPTSFTYVNCLCHSDEQFSPWNSIFPSCTHTRLHINHSHLSFFCIRAVFVYFPWYFTLLEYFSLCRFWLEFRLCYPWICVFACRLDCFFIVVVLSVCWWCLSNALLGFCLSHIWLLSVIISLLSVTFSITFSAPCKHVKPHPFHCSNNSVYKLLFSPFYRT